MFRIVFALLCLALPASAQDLTRVTDRAAFESRVIGQDLSRLGITVRVRPGGVIAGSAFGGEVTGSWDWQDGFFCREMSWGSRSWDWNCQAVYIGVDTVRFIADRGQGDSADLTIQ